MNENYVVTNDYLANNGLDLNDYALEGVYITPIINLGLDLLVNRMCQIGDQFHSEQDIENYLGQDDSVRTSVQKIETFKKAQYRIIYNLIFQNETNPVDQFVDGILVHQLGCKINGFQKGLHYKNN